MARANQRAQAALGDPDPYIDKELKDRDTITSYAKNLNAARKANPALTIASLFNPMFSIPTLAKTAYQTGKARSMLGLTNAEDDDEDDDRDNGDRQTIPKHTCLLYTSPSPRDGLLSRMPSSA